MFKKTSGVDGHVTVYLISTSLFSQKLLHLETRLIIFDDPALLSTKKNEGKILSHVQQFAD
jgi:hypothetical protein